MSSGVVIFFGAMSSELTLTDQQVRLVLTTFDDIFAPGAEAKSFVCKEIGARQGAFRTTGGAISDDISAIFRRHVQGRFDDI
jgi:hypothetical protein